MKSMGNGSEDFLFTNKGYKKKDLRFVVLCVLFLENVYPQKL